MTRIPVYSVFQDGPAWCATAEDFVNIQESPIGFGKTPQEALLELLAEEKPNDAP